MLQQGKFYARMWDYQKKKKKSLWAGTVLQQAARGAGQFPTLEIVKTQLDTDLSNLTWCWSCPCSELEVDESASTGVFPSTLFYNFELNLNEGSVAGLTERERKRQGWETGTVQAVYAIKKCTETCSSKGKEGKTFAPIFNKLMLGLFLR